MNFLWPDVGTGGSRAVVVNAQGQIIAAATIEHAPFASPRRQSRTRVTVGARPPQPCAPS